MAEIRIITATQFLIMALGAAMMNIHLRIVGPSHATALEVFLARRALWLIFVPLLWRGCTFLMARYTLNLKLAILLGRVLIVAMIATYIYAIYGNG